jgi:hypothetical protein
LVLQRLLSGHRRGQTVKTDPSAYSVDNADRGNRTLLHLIGLAFMR